jgi:hypothetical protein
MPRSKRIDEERACSLRPPMMATAGVGLDLCRRSGDGDFEAERLDRF